MVTISMPKNYWDTLNSALSVAEKFYTFNFNDAFIGTSEIAFNSDVEKHNVEFYAEAILKLMFPSGISNISYNPDRLAELRKYQTMFKSGEDGEFDLNTEDMSKIASHIDFVMRICMGQWDNLQNIICNSMNMSGQYIDTCLFMDELMLRDIAEIRGQMLPIFLANGIRTSHASFGIYSDMLHDRVCILYGLYKALRFSVTGSAFDTETVRNSDKPVIITFPYVDSHVVGNHDLLINWLSKYPVGDTFAQKAVYIVDDGKTYVYFNDVASVAVEQGDVIYASVNGRLTIEKGDKIYNYRYMPKF